MEFSGTNSWSCLFSFHIENSVYKGLVTSVQQASDLIRSFEIDTCSKFAVWKVTKRNFGCTEFSPAQSFKVYWGEDNVPYVILNRKVFDCQHGKDRRVAQKEAHKKKLHDQKTLSNHGYKRQSCIQYQDTKKFDCPAQVIIQEILPFQQYKISDKKLDLQRKASKQLKEDVKKEDCLIPSQRLFIVSLPELSQHKNHLTGPAAGISQPLDSRLIEMIEKMVGEGVMDTLEMSRNLKLYVEQNFKQLDSTNKRFYPTLKTIGDHMHLARLRRLCSKDDQVQLKRQTEEWQTEGAHVYFRPRFSSPGTVGEVLEDKFLFAYQSAKQRRLLERYGQIVLLANATYKTSKCVFPLFFLCVKTNVDYVAVGCFLTEDETVSSIAEGLELVKSWSSQWKPQFFMTDFCEEEINAVENVFSECSVYLCDFYREQAWLRWARKKENGVSNFQDEVLARMRRVAQSDNFSIYLKSVQDLRESSVYQQNPKFQRYMEKKWLPQYQSWVWAFQQNGFQVLVKTNNGIEQQNRVLKDTFSYIRKLGSLSVSALMAIVINDFFPDRMQRYECANAKCSSGYRRYNKDIPSFLHDRPRTFLQHCLCRKNSAESIPKGGIQQMTESTYVVNSQNIPSQTYVVDFVSDGMPSCQCEDWRRTLFPCKHMFAVFLNFGYDKWDLIDTAYRDCIYLRLDELYVVSSENIQHLQSQVDKEAVGRTEADRVQEEVELDATNTSVSVEEREDYKSIGIIGLGINIREKLRQIEDLTYIVQDTDVMKIATDKLESIYKDLRLTCHEEDGILIHSPEKTRRRKLPENNRNGAEHPLPPRRECISLKKRKVDS